MYKKIIHNIIEEHFDNPEYASTLPAPQFRPKQAESDEYVKLNMDVKEYFSDYFWRLRLYLISLMASNEDLPAVEAYVFKNIDVLGKIIEPYYGMASANELTAYMRSYAQSVINVFKAVKSGTDTSTLKIAAQAEIDKIATMLRNLNPEGWSFNTLSSVLRSNLYNWMDQAKNRKEKNWDLDFDNAEWGLRQLVAGTRQGYPTFSDIFTKGIIK